MTAEFLMSEVVKITSAFVIGSPSDHFRFSRSSMSQVLPLFVGVIDFASPGAT